MSEPRYTQDIFKRTFLWMSIGWIVMGLCIVGESGKMCPAVAKYLKNP
nr:hypothetical protein [uncultured Acetatifactor sp.]